MSERCKQRRATATCAKLSAVKKGLCVLHANPELTSTRGAGRVRRADTWIARLFVFAQLESFKPTHTVLWGDEEIQAVVTEFEDFLRDNETEPESPLKELYAGLGVIYEK